jgi:hypothetical protein
MGNEEKIYQAEYRTISIKTTDGSTIQGKVNIASRERVSDLFTDSGDPFIILVDVTLRNGHGKILFVNKKHIVWVEPED